MKKRNHILLFFSFLLSVSVYSQWTKKADFGGGTRASAIGFSIGNKGYVGTGAGGNDTILHSDFWEYDPSLDLWTQKADFGGEGRVDAVGFSINGNGYIGMGASTVTYYKDFWEYDTTYNNWTQKADFIGPAKGGTGNSVSFTIGLKAYVGTGNDSTHYPTKDFWEYNSETDMWTQKAFLPVIKCMATSFSIGNKGYIGTGVDTSFPSKDLWEYDNINDVWTQKADFGGAKRYGAVGFSIGAKGYIGLGAVWNGFSNDFWEYDTIANNWTQIDSFPGFPRGIIVSFSIGNKVYLGLGETWGGALNFYKDFWEYTPPPVSTETPTETKTFKVYSDFSSGEIFVVNDYSSKASLTIFNLAGQEVHREEISPVTKKSLLVSHLTTGVYVASLTNKNQTFTQKIIVNSTGK